MPPVSLCALLASPALSARDAEVTVPGEAATLAEAVERVADGGVVSIDGGAAPLVQATASIPIDRTVTIRGVGAARPTLTGGAPGDALFVVQQDEVVLTLEDLDLSGGQASRAVRVNRGNVTLRRVSATDHFASGPGGAIFAESNAGLVRIEDSQLVGGISEAQGGLVAIQNGALVVVRSELSVGSATSGGLVYVNGATVDVIDSTFAQGSTSGEGGAMYLFGADVGHIDRSRFEGNTADGGHGGGAIFAESTELFLNDVWFERNAAQGNEGGGALHLRNDLHHLKRVILCGNTATADGGAIRLRSGTLEGDNLVFIGNLAESEGGAVYVAGGTVPLNHVSIVTSSAGNQTPTPGQAARSRATLTVADSYVADHAGAVALSGERPEHLAVTTTAFARNAGGDSDPPAVEPILDDPGIPPPKSACAPLELLPPPGSPLLGAAANGVDDLGAFGGEFTWTDEDGDGVLSLEDCDDARNDVHPDAIEIPADGVDSNCDGIELCYVDHDGDGLGDPEATVDSPDTHCLGPGEADNDDDACPLGPDDQDFDLDLVPDACDPCPADAGNDSDGDEVCDGADVCPGHDDLIDTDGDGVPNGCDDCPPDGPDADGDGVPDDCDTCERSDDREDLDDDGRPNGCDPCPADPDPTCVSGPTDRTPDAHGDGPAVAIAGCHCAAGGGSGAPVGWLAGAALLGWRSRRRGAVRSGARPAGAEAERSAAGG